MSYRCGPADWIDLAIGRLEDAKRSVRERDGLRQTATGVRHAATSCDICDELRQARRCVRVELDTSVELDVSVNGSCGETVGADVTATAYIEDIKYCPFCGEEL